MSFNACSETCVCDFSTDSLSCPTLANFPDSYANYEFRHLSLVNECLTVSMARKFFKNLIDVSCPADPPSVVGAGSLVGYGILGAVLLVVVLAILICAICFWIKKAHDWICFPPPHGRPQPAETGQHTALEMPTVHAIMG